MTPTAPDSAPADALASPPEAAAPPPGGSRTAKAALLAASQVLNMLLGVALSAGLSWTLEDRSVYGGFQQILLIYSVLAGPLAVGLPNAVYHFLPRLAPAHQKSFLAASHAVLFAAGALLSAAIFFGADLIAGWFDSPHLAPMLRVYFPLPLFALPQMLVDPILVCQSRLPLMVGLQLATRVATAAGVLIPTFLGYDLTVGLFLWVLLTAALEVLTVALLFRPLRSVPASWRPGLGRELLTFVLPIVGITLLSPFAIAGDKMLVSALFGAATYAVYINGTYAVSLSYTIILRAQAILLADFSHLSARGHREEMAALWRRASFKTAMVLFAVVGVVVAGADDIVRVLFSDRYADSADVMRIAVVGVMPRILLTSPALQAEGRSGWYASITLVASVLSPACVVFFGWVLGLGAVGAAMGYVAGEFLHASWQVGLIRFVLKERPSRVLPFGRLAALAAWAAATGLATFGVAGWLLPGVPSIGRLVLAGAVFGPLYLAGALALRIASFEDDVAPLLRLARIPARVVPGWLRR